MSVSVSVLALLGAVALLMVGEPVGAGTAGLIFLLFATLTWTCVRERRWPGRREPFATTIGGVGVRFSYSRFVWWVSVAGLFASVPLVAVMMGYSFTDEDPSRASRGMLVLSPVLGVYVTVLLWDFVTRRLRRGAVFLTVDDVTHRDWGAEFRMSWTDVDFVAAERSFAGHELPSIRLIARQGASATHVLKAFGYRSPARQGIPDMALRADRIEGDAAVLAHTLAFYVANPEHRVELADGRALARVLDGRVIMPELTDGGER